jgi:hypothetical protein
MSPKPTRKPDPRAFQKIGEDITKEEKIDRMKQERDEMIAKFGHPKDKKHGD